MTEDQHSLDRRVDAVEGRVGRVENDHADLRREVAEIRTGMATLHGDLRVNNELTKHIRESVARIENNTRDSFARIETNTDKSLGRLEKSMQDAVDMATTARTVRGLGVGHIVAWLVAGVATALGIFVAWFKG
jgi:chromosome segregation ATPase